MNTKRNRKDFENAHCSLICDEIRNLSNQLKLKNIVNSDNVANPMLQSIKCDICKKSVKHFGTGKNVEFYNVYECVAADAENSDAFNITICNNECFERVIHLTSRK